jgi:aspartyl-tRNA(Asn)/glutamyl-tRNA(Gln) amidotransferase subunit C
MASTDEVKHLAALARLSVSEEELPKLAGEFESILAYVGKLDELELSVKAGNTVPVVHNVFREDGTPNEPGKNTEKLTAAFPQRDGNALSVKQIITHE